MKQKAAQVPVLTLSADFLRQSNFYKFAGSCSLAILNQMAALVPVLAFSGNEHSRSSTALDNNIELKTFTDVATDKRTESKASESKFKTEVEKNSQLKNCQMLQWKIWLR